MKEKAGLTWRSYDSTSILGDFGWGGPSSVKFDVTLQSRAVRPACAFCSGSGPLPFLLDASSRKLL